MSAIDAYLASARARLQRVEPCDLDAAVAQGALLIDIRPAARRAFDGELPGAIVIERNVLEWRLDPTSDHAIPELDDADQRVILVCNEGYASSLAATTLQDLGLRHATDLAGGYRAWQATRR